jgi:hypothetical protein
VAREQTAAAETELFAVNLEAAVVEMEAVVVAAAVVIAKERWLVRKAKEPTAEVSVALASAVTKVGKLVGAEKRWE